MTSHNKRKLGKLELTVLAVNLFFLFGIALDLGSTMYGLNLGFQEENVLGWPHTVIAQFCVFIIPLTYGTIHTVFKKPSSTKRRKIGNLLLSLIMFFLGFAHLFGGLYNLNVMGIL